MKAGTEEVSVREVLLERDVKELPVTHVLSTHDTEVTSIPTETLNHNLSKNESFFYASIIILATTKEAYQLPKVVQFCFSFEVFSFMRVCKIRLDY